jgi:hypothetical protein
MKLFSFDEDQVPEAKVIFSNERKARAGTRTVRPFLISQAKT